MTENFTPFPAGATAEQFLEFEKHQVEQARALQKIREAEEAISRVRCTAFEVFCQETAFSFVVLGVCAVIIFLFYEIREYNSDPAVLRACAANQRVDDENTDLKAQLKDAQAAQRSLLKQLVSDKVIQVEK